MDKFMTGLYNLIEMVQPYLIVIAAVFLLGTAIGCMVPNQEVKRVCRSHIFWIVIGIAVGLLAVYIVKDIAALWTF